jgi:putative membrane protein
MARKPRLDEVGSDPDPRWTLANERTFLAWNQTALALIAAGIAVTQLLPRFDIPGGRRILGLPAIVLGGLIAFTSYARWDAAERAMREGRPLPTSLLPPLLGLSIGCVAIVAAILAATTTR